MALHRTSGTGGVPSTLEAGIAAPLPLSDDYIAGPHGQDVDTLMATGAMMNGAFSEYAWANARQNGNHQSLLKERLPSWPPKDAHKAFGHTYPAQSKRGEQVIGMENMLIASSATQSGDGMSPMFLGANGKKVVVDKNLGESYKLFERFSRTNVPREDGTPEAIEYDMALDIADKIVRGNTLTSTFMTMPGRSPEPASYAQINDLVEEDPTAALATREQGKLYGAAAATNKRLVNLLEADSGGGLVRKRISSSLPPAQLSEEVQKKTEEKSERSDKGMMSLLSPFMMLSDVVAVLLYHSNANVPMLDELKAVVSRHGGAKNAVALVLILVLGCVIVVSIVEIMKTAPKKK